MPGTSIPIIDIEPFIKDGANRQEVVNQVHHACREWGMFHITGHQVSQNLISQVWRETRGFFSLPSNAKQSVMRTKDNARGWYNRELTKNTRDMKEVFDFGVIPHPDLPEEHQANQTHDGMNQWPDSRLCPGFRFTLWEYFRCCEHLALTILDMVGKGLNLSPGQLTKFFWGTHTSFLRLNYYPKVDPICSTKIAKATGHLGVHPHTDAGAVTVLLQNVVDGLQIEKKGSWISVKPLDGALVINLGDMMQVLTNDLYHAPVHRVLASDQHDRYSLPFFFNPPYEVTYAPLKELTDHSAPPHYSPIHWGEFRWKRQQGDFADYGQENQISDYRIRES